MAGRAFRESATAAAVVKEKKLQQQSNEIISS